MKKVDKISNEFMQIPIIVDVEREIDDYRMIRCAYFTIQSDEPLPNWSLGIGNFSSPILLLNLEAILTGSPNNPDKFENVEDIESMYDFIERHDELFVDINDIWVPIEWFGKVDVKQGMVFRIPEDRFSICWRLRNDRISIEEMFSDENVKEENIKLKLLQEPHVHFSDNETHVFNQWTKLQIEKSKERYNKNKDRTLKKIRE